MKLKSQRSSRKTSKHLAPSLPSQDLHELVFGDWVPYELWPLDVFEGGGVDVKEVFWDVVPVVLNQPRPQCHVLHPGITVSTTTDQDPVALQ